MNPLFLSEGFAPAIIPACAGMTIKGRMRERRISVYGLF